MSKATKIWVFTLAALALGAPAAHASATTSAFDAAVATRSAVAPPITPQPIDSNRLVSRRGSGKLAQNPSGGGSLSADGRWLLFDSADPRIVAGRTISGHQVYLRDLTTGETLLVSRAQDGTEGNAESRAGEISADGTEMVFVSAATNLVSGDSNSVEDVYAFDATNGTTRLISKAPDGTPANGASGAPAISADGLHVAYESAATNLVPGIRFFPGAPDQIYLYDGPTDRTSIVSRSPAGTAADLNSGDPDISGDGSRVVFWSMAYNLVPGAGDRGDIFLWSRSTHQVELASRTVDGQPYYGHKYFPPAISADGRIIAFSSTASSLPDDPVIGGEFENLYLYDVSTHVTRLVTRGYDGRPAGGSDGLGSKEPDLSADGSRVTFHSGASNLVPGDVNDRYAFDVFEYDVATDVTTLISADPGGSGADGSSDSPAISADGAYVAYQSNAVDIVRRDSNDVTDVFVYRLS